MKKTFFLCVVSFMVLSIFQGAYSQKINPGPKLLSDMRVAEAFGQSFVDRIENENPDLLVYYNFFLDNSYYITELPADKSEFLSSLPVLSVSPEAELKDINVLKYEIKLNFDKETYFRMENSNKVMVFYTGEKLNEKYNQHRKALGLVTESKTK